MARPLRIQYPGAFYHVTSRGNERKPIYKSVRDREAFLGYLESAAMRYGAVIHCYCMMDNHYHLLLETPEANLSAIMRHINGAYTTYFNVKRKRSGHLFQGRYKALLVDKDAYAMELSRYIHLNPVRAKMVEKPEDHRWSSYRSYVGIKQAPAWLFIDFVLAYFGPDKAASRKEYRRFVESALGQELESPMEELVAGTILGADEFVRKIKSKYLDVKKAERNVPDIRKLVARPGLDEIERAVLEEFKDGKKLSQTVKLYLGRKLTGERLSEIGKRYGVGDSAVSEAARRLCARMEREKELARRVRSVEEGLKTCRMDGLTPILPLNRIDGKMKFGFHVCPI